MLSIIIPVYNTSAYLGRCMDSLLSQIESGVEIIIIDDGSTDGSSKMCDDYGKYDFVRVCHKENGGLASARNKGIEMAEGEYITFLDSDDWLEDGAIKEFLAIIDGFKPDVIGFGCQKVSDSKVYRKTCQPWSKDFHTDMDEIKADVINDKELFSFGILRSSCMHIFRKAIIDELELRFIPEQIVLNEDYLFVTEFILNASNYYCCKEFFYNYYFRENSLTTSYLTDMFARKGNLYREYEKLLAGLAEEYQYRLKLFYLNNCYECLANESRMDKKDKVQEILDDIKRKDVLKDVRLDEQTFKARIFLRLMAKDNAFLYIRFYRLFSVIKGLKNGYKKHAGV